ncbi:MAG: NAD(P)/FAD-dependent oxidoreductase [Coprococcus sp.]|nr:NAD(P)/FAD-dependent oxidoreductase [Coprococcus sp.]
MSKVLIAGGGAAGMFASVFAAKNGNEVHLYEKNEKLGKKLYITGKGRCNLTNACDTDVFFENVISNPKFMYGSFYSFGNQDVMEFFQSAGLALKTERGQRVFPVSDHSSDVIRTLEKEMKSAGVHVHLRSRVKRVGAEEGYFSFLELADGKRIRGDACIVATGGLSYPSTGSTGDGYRFAKALGHTLTECSPSLVPLEIKDAFVSDLMGLSLRNVRASIYDGDKMLYEGFGEMLFTHFGVSGPLMLSASAYVGNYLHKGKELVLAIDLKPALSHEQLDARLLREFETKHNKQFKNALSDLFPSKFIPVMIKKSKIDPDKKVNTVSREERLGFASLIKNIRMTITGLRDYDEAVVTRGGVRTSEINPSTMESKKVKGLYFAGEVLDVDALTGGFNLQVAWSTGHAAGSGIW